uniref:DUF273 domain-containing protein n=1 Tax=Methylobacterium sp. B34 TaxID=95563 RepID=UPI000FE13F2F|nr:DUF273 domain-containing protein [Methylobacterium sp. B34]
MHTYPIGFWKIPSNKLGVDKVIKFWPEKLKKFRSTVSVIDGDFAGTMYTFTPQVCACKRKTILKVANSIDYVARYEESISSTLNYCKRHDYDLLLYIAHEDDWLSTNAKHFCKIAGTRAALDIGYEWVLFNDLDTLVSNYDISIEQWTTNSFDLLLQKEQIICSCMFLFRNSNWSRQFLQRWWELGIMHDCREHSFDQIAYWGALMGENCPKALKQDDWPEYCDWINNNIPNQSGKIGWITEPSLHSAPWNEIDADKALFLHTGNAKWDIRHELF